jgi:uncharacterized FAD-dependent dehydrogenase
MHQDINIVVTPENSKDLVFIKKKVCYELGVNIEEPSGLIILKRSIDARKSDIKINLRIRLFFDEEPHLAIEKWNPKDVSDSKRIAIIGFGPAGMFAAMKAIELGLKPVVFERGKQVRDRRRDLVEIHRNHKINPDSNYCFGEGGAGTFSDGKLYTRSKKRGNVKKALDWLVQFGAPEDILVDAHPHIGTNKLPKIIEQIREAIILKGGEIHFNSRFTDFKSIDGSLKQIKVNDSWFDFEHCVLATGHSARDIFELLNDKKLQLTAKPIAIGVRVEHPQALINNIQYHNSFNPDFLPPASYSLVEQARGRGVYSFCMCPGGIIAPCATSQDEVVTNGWSPSKRNNQFANSGMVVEIHPEDIADGKEIHAFTTLDYQKDIEKACWEAAGKTQQVPAQRLLDFMNNRVSKDLPESSYQPGIISRDLNAILPRFITDRLKQGFKTFGNKLNGFLTNDAVLHAPESRTSSPIQIPRNEHLCHPEVIGLYPSAEGAGYAGGIMSAAIDGMRCVDAIFEDISGN